MLEPEFPLADFFITSHFIISNHLVLVAEALKSVDFLDISSAPTQI